MDTGSAENPAACLHRHLASPEVSVTAYLEGLEMEVAQRVSRPRKLYLDTCYWVFLRDSALGRVKKAEHLAMLQRLRELVATGKAVCPVSDIAFMELTSQTDDETRHATAKLWDELSLGTALTSEQERVRRELECFFTNPGNLNALQALRQRMWTQPCYVLGRTTASIDENRPELDRAFQKASIDALWPTTFAELAAEPSGSLGMNADFQKSAEHINNTMRQHQHEIPSFERAFCAEVSGAVDVYRETLAGVIYQAWAQTGSSGQTPSEAELAAVTDKFRLVLVNAFRLRRQLMAQHLPTLYVYASCHAAVRMDVKRKFTGNFLRDIHHGAAGAAYHDAMLTERPLRALLMAGKVVADKTFDCRIICDEVEALDYIEAIG